MGSTALGEFAVPDRVPFSMQSFALKDVRLLDGPFKAAQDRAVKYLLELEPDRLLAGFREEAGLKPKKPAYGGWEARGIAGHSLGHYLAGCAMAYASTGDEEFKKRSDYIVSELAECQRAMGTGYVSAIPSGDRVFVEVARGDIRSQGFDLNGEWVPWYTMHKIFAGLVEAYRQTGNEQAKTVVVGLAEWAGNVIKNLDDGQVQRMLACEHGGMVESLADVYAMTGNEKYLALSKRFIHHAIANPLAAGHDELGGKHANTQVPKIVGHARRYELSNDDFDRRVASFFWDTVIKNHTYVTGGNSLDEHFGPAGKLSERLGQQTTETCNTNNMLRLTHRLMMWTGQPSYADYFERALINHILASQDPKTGAVTYFCTLRPGAQRKYESLFEVFSCCVGTGMENHVRYGSDAYYYGKDNAGGDTLVVAQFIASELNWADKGITLRQETTFPETDTTRLTVKAERPADFTMQIRWPYWAQRSITIKVNGEPQQVSGTPGSFVSLKRTWSDGDAVTVEMPMTLRTESMPDNPDKIAVMYGPLVMSAKMDESDLMTLPVLVAKDKPIEQWLKPVDGQPLTFRSQNVAKPADVTFIPYYQAHHVHVTTYLDRFDEAQWAKREADFRAEQERLAAIERRTVDTLKIGEMQPERDHNLDGDRTNVGEHQGRKWRDATDGGRFAFDLKVDDQSKSPQQLVMTYWGSDAGNRVFDILVDGKRIATERLDNKKPGEFIDVAYDLPAPLIANKQTIRVTIQAKPGAMAGGLFGARIMRRE